MAAPAPASEKRGERKHRQERKTATGGMYRGPALHGADGEAEGDEVDEQDGCQHLGGAGHWVRSVKRRGPGEGFGLTMVLGFQTCGARLVAGAFAVWQLG